MSCTSLKTITIPASVTYLGYSVFTGCSSLQTIRVNQDNPFFCAVDGILYSKDQKNLLVCPGGKTSVTIPNSVVKICQGAFYDCEKLTSITIPYGVTEIDTNAFCDCTSLLSVSLSNSITTIGQFAFSNTSITSITIPNSVSLIDGAAFADCKLLKSITLPNSVSSISYSTFSGCISLESIVIPASVTSIGSNAFYNCSSLQNIFFYGSSEQWEQITDNYSCLPNDATKYFYSNENPSSEGNFWHYVDNVPTIWE